MIGSIRSGPGDFFLLRESIKRATSRGVVCLIEAPVSIGRFESITLELMSLGWNTLTKC